jgi:hypothetical protein
MPGRAGTWIGQSVSLIAFGPAAAGQQLGVVLSEAPMLIEPSPHVDPCSQQHADTQKNENDQHGTAPKPDPPPALAL